MTPALCAKNINQITVVQKNYRASQLLAAIESQIDIISGIRSDLENSIPLWKIGAMKAFEIFLEDDHLSLFDKIEAKSWAREKELYINFMNELKRGVLSSPDSFVKSEVNGMNSDRLSSSSNKFGKVFLVHGHDDLAKIEVARFLEKIKLSPVILHEQPNEGKTIIEKFERDAGGVDYAVVLMTPDDFGYQKDRPAEVYARARQNVILELGFFSGVLGRQKVCVLVKGGVEVPSDYMGVVYINMDTLGAWKISLAREIRGSGIGIDLAGLF